MERVRTDDDDGEGLMSYERTVPSSCMLSGRSLPATLPTPSALLPAGVAPPASGVSFELVCLALDVPVQKKNLITALKSINELCLVKFFNSI